jgi:hypothetical protein
LKILIFAWKWEATQSLQQTRSLGAREMDIKDLRALFKRKSIPIELHLSNPKLRTCQKNDERRSKLYLAFGHPLSASYSLCGYLLDSVDNPVLPDDS